MAEPWLRQAGWTDGPGLGQGQGGMGKSELATGQRGCRRCLAAGARGLASRASRLLPCLCRQPMVPPPEAMAMLVSLRAEPCARPDHDLRWPVPAGTGRYWSVLASSRSRLARRPWASPAADPAGPSCRPPCSACPFDAWGLSRPPGGQAAVLQAEHACPAAWAPRHAATARPDPQGVCAVKGKLAGQAYSRMRNVQATLCGQAGSASAGSRSCRSGGVPWLAPAKSGGLQPCRGLSGEA